VDSPGSERYSDSMLMGEYLHLNYWRVRWTTVPFRGG
jgi:hypothetical protein